MRLLRRFAPRNDKKKKSVLKNFRAEKCYNYAPELHLNENLSEIE